MRTEKVKKWKKVRGRRRCSPVGEEDKEDEMWNAIENPCLYRKKCNGHNSRDEESFRRSKSPCLRVWRETKSLFKSFRKACWTLRPGLWIKIAGSWIKKHILCFPFYTITLCFLVLQYLLISSYDFTTSWTCRVIARRWIKWLVV